MSTPPQSPPARKRVTLLALCLAAFIISLDVTIVNVALPSLVRQAGATTTDLQWVVDAYNLVFAALVLVTGSLSDRLGRKGMLLAGLGVFGAASLAGSLAASTGQLIGARIPAEGHRDPGLPAQLLRSLPRRRRRSRRRRPRGHLPAPGPARRLHDQPAGRPGSGQHCRTFWRPGPG